MPLQIDEVHAEVVVDPAQSAGESNAGRVLPTAHECGRFAELSRRVAQDAWRTHARDCDD